MFFTYYYLTNLHVPCVNMNIHTLFSVLYEGGMTVLMDGAAAGRHLEWGKSRIGSTRRGHFSQLFLYIG